MKPLTCWALLAQCCWPCCAWSAAAAGQVCMGARCVMAGWRLTQLESGSQSQRSKAMHASCAAPFCCMLRIPKHHQTNTAAYPATLTMQQSLAHSVQQHLGSPHAFGSRKPRVRTCTMQCSCLAQPAHQQQVPGRRQLLAGLAAAAAAAAVPLPAQAVGFKKELKKRKVPLEDYAVSEADGLRYFDSETGRGKAITPGDKVVVHFDCRFRGIDAVSSRYARTLGGNRTIAEPYEFVAGKPVSGPDAKKAGDTAGGLFAGGSGPKPPPALSTAVIGMKPGGKRVVYVDVPELGYLKGNQEIPAGAAFELAVEVLSVL